MTRVPEQLCGAFREVPTTLGTEDDGIPTSDSGEEDGEDFFMDEGDDYGDIPAGGSIGAFAEPSSRTPADGMY